jgi:hypothetical protein
MKTLILGMTLTFSVLGFALFFLPAQTDANASASLRGPEDYEDSQWTTVNIRNKDAAGNYSATITICTNDPTPGVEKRGGCISYTRAQDTLPTPARTIVDAMIEDFYDNGIDPENDQSNAQYRPSP